MKDERDFCSSRCANQFLREQKMVTEEKKKIILHPVKKIEPYIFQREKPWCK
jgi:hypothetical protein